MGAHASGGGGGPEMTTLGGVPISVNRALTIALTEIDRLRAALDARDAAIKVAEEALDNAKVDYKISLRGGIVDEAIRRELTALCKQHGYGNVITSASGLWRAIDEVGAFTSGPCCESVRYALKLINSALAALAAAKEANGR